MKKDVILCTAVVSFPKYITEEKFDKANGLNEIRFLDTQRLKHGVYCFNILHQSRLFGNQIKAIGTRKTNDIIEAPAIDSRGFGSQENLIQTLECHLAWIEEENSARNTLTWKLL